MIAERYYYCTDDVNNWYQFCIHLFPRFITIGAISTYMQYFHLKLHFPYTLSNSLLSKKMEIKAFVFKAKSSKDLILNDSAILYCPYPVYFKKQSTKYTYVYISYRKFCDLEFQNSIFYIKRAQTADANLAVNFPTEKFPESNKIQKSRTPLKIFVIIALKFPNNSYHIYVTVLRYVNIFICLIFEYCCYHARRIMFNILRHTSDEATNLFPLIILWLC